MPSTSGNKFRNQINQNTPPDVLNVNQQRHYHGIVDNYNTNSRDYALGKLRCNSTELTAHGQGKNGTYSEYSDNGQSSASTSATAGLASNGGSESNLLNSIVNHTNNDNRFVIHFNNLNFFVAGPSTVQILSTENMYFCLNFVFFPF